MPKKIEMVGKRFGKLTVIAESVDRKGGGECAWICKCDCGTITKPIRGKNLRNGQTKSCGCLLPPGFKNKHHCINTAIHGKRTTRLYRIWCAMKQRCFYPKHKGFECYGGRGIKVCDEWCNNFSAFYEWAMANGYSDNLTIDRINNDGNYEPSNCRWATMKEQQNNRRNNRQRSEL